MYSQRLVLPIFAAVLIYFGASANEGSEAIARWSGELSMSASTYTAVQNAGSVTITVNRIGGVRSSASVSYATANVSALAGTDYTATHGSLSWGSRDASPKSFVIPISNAAPFTGGKTFAVAIAGASGASLGTTTSAIVTINGDASSQPAASLPTVTLSASPTSVSSGSGSTLTWSSTNATSCTASGAWSGTEAVSGTYGTGALSSNATYTLTCTGTGGSVSQSATVTVTASTPPPTAASCTGTSGTLALNVNAVRGSGISPFLVFFDASGTTDSSISGNTTPFQDVTYTWNFGDTGTSGTNTWAYGANPGHNTRNTATGGVAAHLYVTPGVDTAYVVTVTANNGTNTASCQLGVTAYDPSGSSGFAGTKTTCVSASGTPTPGSGGCPAGAVALNSSSFNTALGSAYSGSGKRVLFKCGDTFSGDNATLSGTTWSVGAYGGCEGTQTNQPVFNDTAGTGNSQLSISPNAGDGRISDIYFNGNGTGGGAVSTIAFVTQNIPYQITMWNLQSTGNRTSYASSQSAQWGLIGSTVLNAKGIAVFFNNEGNNPANFLGTYPNLNYMAVLGNFVNGVGSAGGSGAGIEAFRTSACRLCVFENNTIENANNVGGVFKLHNANTYGSLPTWTGVYTELIEISDNLFTGNSGGILSDIAPQNGGLDERLRNFVIERNLYSASTTAWGGTLLMVSGANMTLRDNVFYMPAQSSTMYAQNGAVVAQRGSGNLFAVEYNEAYNNTCYAPNVEPHQLCIGFDTGSSTVKPTANSVAKNNLFYVPSQASGPAVDDTGSGNTVSNNTATVTNNPGFTNGSGSFGVISDFKPTANYSGGATVPVRSDALGLLWSPAWDLGAVHQ